MDYTELLGYVDVHKAQFIEEFKGLVRIPSVSTRNERLDKAADYVIRQTRPNGPLRRQKQFA